MRLAGCTRVLGMTPVVGVRFQPYGTLHLLRLREGQSFGFGDRVRYPAEGGHIIGTVAWSGQSDAAQDAPVCAGPASQEDLTREHTDRVRRAEIAVAARALIKRHNLPMRVLAVDHQQSDSGQPLAVIYYSAPERVDFRAMLSDLGRALQCRLDLRQVAERDAAMLVSDIGSCGRPSCCTTCLQAVKPVPGSSGRMLHSAGLGACGRPMCCLTYGECGARG